MDDRELLGITRIDRAWWRGTRSICRRSQPLEPLDPIEAVAISATTGAGIDRLIAAIGDGARHRTKRFAIVRRSPTCGTRCFSSERANLSTRAATALESEVSEEFPLLDLQEAGAALQEITGRRTTRRSAASHLRALLHRQVSSTAPLDTQVALVVRSVAGQIFAGARVTSLTRAPAFARFSASKLRRLGRCRRRDTARAAARSYALCLKVAPRSVSVHVSCDMI